MTDTPTKPDVGRLKELRAKATPGPWQKHVYNEPFPYYEFSQERHGLEKDWHRIGNNAALIVAVVNALPSLLATVEALGEAEEALRDCETGLTWNSSLQQCLWRIRQVIDQYFARHPEPKP